MYKKIPLLRINFVIINFEIIKMYLILYRTVHFLPSISFECTVFNVGHPADFNCTGYVGAPLPRTNRLS
jgi:hypothetical protein